MYPLRKFDKKLSLYRNFFIIIHSRYNNIWKNETADLIPKKKNNNHQIISF